MSPRQYLESPALKLVVYALLVGIAWANLKAEVATKADKATVEEMAHNVRDIKNILCARAAKQDSFCLDFSAPK